MRRTLRTPAIIGTLLSATLMLFSMFFGAGNLIFPPFLGASSGEHFIPAILGFITAGVLLPVISIVAVVITGDDILDLSRRAGKAFGIVAPILIYLSIGAFYAVPRTAVVSYSTAFSPVFHLDSKIWEIAFSAVYFFIVWLLCFRPTGLIDRLGKYLTPVLLVLLAIMIIVALTSLTNNGAPATEKYAHTAFAPGLVEGYLTMDSIAAVAFGIVVVGSLREKGFGGQGLHAGVGLRRGAVISSVGAGIILAIVYYTLGLVGRVIPHPENYEDGATMLTDVAYITMGTPGRVLFGVVVLLACLGTAAGLIGSTSDFFHRIIPRVSYQQWVVIFTLISFAVSTMGLKTVLAIAGPIIGFLYPPTIALVGVTLLEPLFRRRLHYAFYCAVYVAVIWSVLMTLQSLGIGENSIGALIDWVPLHNVQLGWILPSLCGLLIGAILDFTVYPAQAARRGIDSTAHYQSSVAARNTATRTTEETET